MSEHPLDLIRHAIRYDPDPRRPGIQVAVCRDDCPRCAVEQLEQAARNLWAQKEAAEAERDAAEAGRDALNDEIQREYVLRSTHDAIVGRLARQVADLERALRRIAEEPPPQAWADASEIARAALAAGRSRDPQAQPSADREEPQT